MLARLFPVGIQASQECRKLAQSVEREAWSRLGRKMVSRAPSARSITRRELAAHSGAALGDATSMGSSKKAVGGCFRARARAAVVVALVWRFLSGDFSRLG